MNTYVKIIFRQVRQEQTELLIAYLSEAGYNGFEEGQSFLFAYCDLNVFDEEALKLLSESLAVNYEKELIEETNWNEEWEKNFQPVRIDDFCVIRAAFHQPVRGVSHEVIITPKMSFGTGHHATTFMMIQWMKEIDHRGKRVLDFGTGTGVLAILAEKLGARQVVAIDNDDWSILNAAENLTINGCARIELQKADSLAFAERFDIIFANINKNVLVRSMGLLQQHLEKGGVLVVSGILEGDLTVIEEKVNDNNLSITGKAQKDGWISLHLTYY